MNSFDPWYSKKGFKMKNISRQNLRPQINQNYSNSITSQNINKKNMPAESHWVTRSCFMIETDATERFPTSRTWELLPNGTEILCHYSNNEEKFVRIQYKNGNIYNGTISWEGNYLVGTLNYKDSSGRFHALNYNKTINSIETENYRLEKKISLDEIIKYEEENLSPKINASRMGSTSESLGENFIPMSGEPTLAHSSETTLTHSSETNLNDSIETALTHSSETNLNDSIETTKNELSMLAHFQNNEDLSFIHPCESPTNTNFITTFSSPEISKTISPPEESKSNKKTKPKKKIKKKLIPQNNVLNLKEERIRLPNKWLFTGITQLLDSKNAPSMPSYGVARKNENEFYEGSFLPYTKKRSYENQVGQFENGIHTIKNKEALIKIKYENGVVIDSEYYPKGAEKTFPYFSGKLDQKNKPTMGTLWYNNEISFHAQINFNFDHTIQGNLIDTDINVDISFDSNLTPLRGSGELYLEYFDTPNGREFVKKYTGPLFWERGFDTFEPDGEGGILTFHLGDEEYTLENCVYAEGHLIMGEGTYVTENDLDIFHGRISDTMAEGILISPSNKMMLQNKIHQLTSTGTYSFDCLEDNFKLIRGFGEIYLNSNTIFFGRVNHASLEYGIRIVFEPSKINYFFGHVSKNKGIYREKKSEIKIGQFNTDEFDKILNLASGFYLSDEIQNFLPIKEVKENSIVNEYTEENITQEKRASVYSNFSQFIIPLLNPLSKQIKYLENKDEKFKVNIKFKSIYKEVFNICLLMKNNYNSNL